VTAAGATQQQPYHHGNLRSALVQAAVELAREGGPPAIVLREAARRIGVSPTAAYRHFAALPQLVAAVAHFALGELARSMEAELAGCRPGGNPQQDAWDSLRAVGRGYVHFALEEPGLFAVAFRREKRSVDPEPGTGASGLSPRDLLERALDGMLTAGALAPEDRTAAATTAWAAVHGLSLLLLGPMGGVPSVEREAEIEAALDLIGRGLIVRD